MSQAVARGFQKQFLPHRVAGGPALGAGAEGIRERLADPAGQRHQATVGGTGHGVLLVDHQRHAGQFGRQPAGTGDVAAKPQHTDRTQLTDDAARLEQRANQLQRSLDQRRQTFAAQSTDLNQMQWQPGSRHQFVLDATRRAEPMHGIATRLELARAGQRREYVPTGTAGHDQDISGHERPPWPRARQSRTRRTRCPRCPVRCGFPTRCAAAAPCSRRSPPASCRRN